MPHSHFYWPDNQSKPLFTEEVILNTNIALGKYPVCCWPPRLVVTRVPTARCAHGHIEIFQKAVPVIYEIMDFTVFIHQNKNRVV